MLRSPSVHTVEMVAFAVASSIALVLVAWAIRPSLVWVPAVAVPPIWIGILAAGADGARDIAGHPRRELAGVVGGAVVLVAVVAVVLSR